MSKIETVTDIAVMDDAAMTADELMSLAAERYNEGDLVAAEALCNHILASKPDHPQAGGMLSTLVHFAHTQAARQHFPGSTYLSWLQWFQTRLKPATYLEIGVESGQSLQYAKAPTRAVGVDPAINVVHPQETWSKLFKLPSDDFFAQHDLRDVLDTETVDLAFIDGLHTFDQALRDFINIERYAGPQTVVLFHDIFPVTPITAARDRASVFWLGDTWKVMLILRELRPDLNVFTIPTFPSGLGVVTRLDAESQVLRRDINHIIERWLPVDLATYSPDLGTHLNAVDNDFVTVSRLLRG